MSAIILLYVSIFDVGNKLENLELPDTVIKAKLPKLSKLRKLLGSELPNFAPSIGC